MVQWLLVYTVGQDDRTHCRDVERGQVPWVQFMGIQLNFTLFLYFLTCF